MFTYRYPSLCEEDKKENRKVYQLKYRVERYTSSAKKKPEEKNYLRLKEKKSRKKIKATSFYHSKPLIPSNQKSTEEDMKVICRDIQEQYGFYYSVNDLKTLYLRDWLYELCDSLYRTLKYYKFYGLRIEKLKKYLSQYSDIFSSETSLCRHIWHNRTLLIKEGYLKIIPKGV